jgi:hypothetical protein
VAEGDAHALIATFTLVTSLAPQPRYVQPGAVNGFPGPPYTGGGRRKIMKQVLHEWLSRELPRP